MCMSQRLKLLSGQQKFNLDIDRFTTHYVSYQLLLFLSIFRDYFLPRNVVLDKKKPFLKNDFICCINMYLADKKVAIFLCLTYMYMTPTVHKPSAPPDVRNDKEMTSLYHHCLDLPSDRLDI